MEHSCVPVHLGEASLLAPYGIPSFSVLSHVLRLTKERLIQMSRLLRMPTGMELRLLGLPWAEVRLLSWSGQGEVASQPKQ